ncbi:hypothetical protein [Paenibacillus eucommiae]|uniref:Uncharacterized protein n=1 Tax=Paenibacillus eucommiae TaxID=1355755 RepID=A0ABS4J1V9_9BACL|nr:hypothetical protein [Paenibacillus eucommiae]MBP1993829.1 hypothetical protein [Paenibacillus eucommiae]
MNVKKMMPFPFFWDDAAIDLTSVFRDEKPAGWDGTFVYGGFAASETVEANRYHPYPR